MPPTRSPRSWSSLQPLAGRRLHFVGIGGAGLSGYALLAHAWGAEVSGWDRYETPYLRLLPEEIEVTISPEPVPPPGAETIVSTAFAGRVAGRSRADFLGELVSLQDSIVVAGAHGKTTTAAMIAFVLDRLDRDPGFLIGAEVPQLGGNARAGSGWLVIEGDESDRTIEQLRPKIAVLTNVDLDHHSEFASRAALREQGGGRVLALFQPHLYSRTRYLARETAAALADADLVAVTEVYPAREEPVEGVTGKLVVDALAELRPGMTIGWTPRVEDGAHFVARRARPGDIVLTVGAGDVDRAAPLVLEALE